MRVNFIFIFVYLVSFYYPPDAFIAAHSGLLDTSNLLVFECSGLLNINNLSLGMFPILGAFPKSLSYCHEKASDHNH
jgi:hypothetical protein